MHMCIEAPLDCGELRVMVYVVLLLSSYIRSHPPQLSKNLGKNNQREEYHLRPADPGRKFQVPVR